MSAFINSLMTINAVYLIYMGVTKQTPPEQVNGLAIGFGVYVLLDLFFDFLHHRQGNTT